jgi:hypothetical protein
MTAITADVLSFRSPRFRAAAPPPDLSVQAVPLLTRLRDALRLSADLLTACEKRREATERKHARWGEPPIFFFGSAAQAEWGQTRPAKPPFPAPYLAEMSARMPEAATAWRTLPDLLDDALTLLPVSVESRRVARATDELTALAKTVGKHLLDATEVAELLAVPDEEVLLVVDVDRRTAARVLLTGVADVYQLMIHLADVLPGRRRPDPRVAAAYRNLDAAPSATVAEAPFQLLRPDALRPDGTLPDGFAASDHWLWGPEPTARLPRENGERIALLTAATVPHSWDVGRRFPRLPARTELIEVLPREAVSGWLRSRCPAFAEPVPELVRAAA